MRQVFVAPERLFSLMQRTVILSPLLSRHEHYCWPEEEHRGAVGLVPGP